jgi:hypothetical protein
VLGQSKGLFAVGAERIENPDPSLYGEIRHGEKNLLPGEKGPLVITQYHGIHLVLFSVATYADPSGKAPAALVYSRAGGFPREEPKIFLRLLQERDTMHASKKKIMF